MNFFYYSKSYVYLSLKMSFKVNMTKNLSYTESYAATLLLELKEKQVSQISNRTNKKRKKYNSSGLEEKAHKKIKANQNDDKHDDNDDDDDKHDDKHDDDDNNKHDDEYVIFRNDRVQINKNWYSTFNKVKKYINNKKKRPSIHNKDKKLAFWIRAQLTNHKNQEYNMKDKKIYCEWTKFMKKYQKYFLNICDKWYDTLKKVQKYIDINKKKPNQSEKDKEIQKLGRWIATQQSNYKKEKYNMKNTNIYSKWTQFMKKYQKYF